MEGVGQIFSILFNYSYFVIYFFLLLLKKSSLFFRGRGGHVYGSWLLFICLFLGRGLGGRGDIALAFLFCNSCRQE